jgi:hypothetical protein
VLDCRIEFPGHESRIRPKPLPTQPQSDPGVKRTDSGESFHSAKAGPPVAGAEPDEDGVLRREYVLVDETNAVEFNRVVDGSYPSS